MRSFLGTLLSLGPLSGCATVHVAENVRMISFSDKPNTKDTKSVGNIEGKDCTWYAVGYPLGGDPTVRSSASPGLGACSPSLGFSNAWLGEMGRVVRM